MASSATTMKPFNKQRYLQPFVALVVAIGAAVVGLCLYSLQPAQLHTRLLLLLVISVALGSRVIHIPRIKGEITVTDTLIFLTMLLYSGEAAVLIGSAAAFCSSLQVTKKVRVHLFNTAVMACSTFLTVMVLRLCFGHIRLLATNSPSASFVTALCLMALVQYVANSGLVTIYTGCKMNEPFWLIWRKYYLWGLLSSFAGASAALIIVRLTSVVGFYAVITTLPIIAIVYFTYQTYLKNIETSADQVERTERHVEELNHYIAEQERIQQQFSQIEKMSALGELASGVAHDFNNTLAGILGRAQLMLMKANDPEIERGLNIIIQAAEDGSKTVKRIQDFAHQRRDRDFAPLAVDQLLMDVNEITRPRWKDHAQAANVHIHLDLQVHTAAFVMGDASELREVLVNMVFNAVDAMPAGGQLTLSANERDGFVEISISDTGTGMNQEVRSRVFDPFFTTKGEAGMGLGLAVCYGIIQRHEGTIEVESRSGQGTTFRIKLAIAEIKPATLTEVATGPRLTLVSSSNSPRILVVDDEECIRELLSDILDREGYEVTLAESGSEALELFDTQSFKAVFTDVGMPGMSGWELARAIRERNNDIPLAVITGWGDAVSSTEREEARVDWVVAKPFSIDSIAEIVADIARRNGMQTGAFPIAATGT
jgi:signal transduction histidine kinase/ActR/RegA family two-component response regulator